MPIQTFYKSALRKREEPKMIPQRNHFPISRMVPLDIGKMGQAIFCVGFSIGSYEG